MSGRIRSIFLSVLGIGLLAGCGSSGEAAGEQAEETVTATATVTVTAAPAEPSPLTGPPPFADLVTLDDEYGATTVRNIARVICKEVRTGDRDPSLPWRRMIGYAGERTVGAFIAYSVAFYCPEEGHGLIEAD